MHTRSGWFSRLGSLGYLLLASHSLQAPNGASSHRCLLNSVNVWRFLVSPSNSNFKISQWTLWPNEISRMKQDSYDWSKGPHCKRNFWVEGTSNIHFKPASRTASHYKQIKKAGKVDRYRDWQKPKPKHTHKSSDTWKFHFLSSDDNFFPPQLEENHPYWNILNRPNSLSGFSALGRRPSGLGGYLWTVKKLLTVRSHCSEGGSGLRADWGREEKWQRDRTGPRRWGKPPRRDRHGTT